MMPLATCRCNQMQSWKPGEKGIVEQTRIFSTLKSGGALKTYTHRRKVNGRQDIVHNKI